MIMMLVVVIVIECVFHVVLLIIVVIMHHMHHVINECLCLQFPFCDGAHNEHNKATGDNLGPLVVAAPKVS